jgi:hypothetical protein
MSDQPTTPISIATNFCRHRGKHHPVLHQAHRVASQAANRLQLEMWLR